MKNIYFIIFTLYATFSYSQNRITITIPGIEKKDSIIQVKSRDENIGNMLSSEKLYQTGFWNNYYPKDARVFKYNDIIFKLRDKDEAKNKKAIKQNKYNKDSVYNSIKDSIYPILKQELLKDIICYSELPPKFRSHIQSSFIYCVTDAYNNHLPLVLTPDMIWLLIQQGFGQHIFYNSYKLKDSLILNTAPTILSTKIQTNSVYSATTWENVISSLSDTLQKYTQNNITNILQANYSTTSTLEKTVSTITTLDAFSSYFEFGVMLFSCGIPEIKLVGTTQDWELLKEKVLLLEKYDLQWWTKELIPILNEFTNASKGEINTDFWKKIYTMNPNEVCGPPSYNGWIFNFYPYDKSGYRYNFKEKDGLYTDEVSSFLVHVTDETSLPPKGYNVEIWGGFLGYEQDPITFALKPLIGWFVRDNSNLEKANVAWYKKERNINFTYELDLNDIPYEITQLKKINRLSVAFKSLIYIPEELSKVKINKLILTGKIDEKGIERIKSLFPKTKIIINGKLIEKKK